MTETSIKSKKSDLFPLGLKSGRIHLNYSPSELYEEELCKKEGILTIRGSLMIETSFFTGRTPEDKSVDEDETAMLETRKTNAWKS